MKLGIGKSLSETMKPFIFKWQVISLWKLLCFGYTKTSCILEWAFLFTTFPFQFSLTLKNSQMSINRERPCVSVLPKYFLCTYCIFLICGTYWQRLKNLEKKMHIYFPRQYCCSPLNHCHPHQLSKFIQVSVSIRASF